MLPLELLTVLPLEVPDKDCRIVSVNTACQAVTVVLLCTDRVASFLATHGDDLKLHCGVSADPTAVEQPPPAWFKHSDNITYHPDGVITATAADYGCFQSMREEMQNGTNTLFSVTYVGSREPHTLTLCCKFEGRDTWEEGLGSEGISSPVDADSMEALLDKERSKKRGCPAKMYVSISEVVGASVHVWLSLQHSGHDACGSDELQEMKLHYKYVVICSCIYSFCQCTNLCQLQDARLQALILPHLCSFSTMRDFKNAISLSSVVVLTW